MAISNTDQFTPSEPEVTIRAPEVDDEAEDTQDAEPQFQPNAAKQSSKDGGPSARAAGGESRKAKREASLAAMSSKVRDEVSGSVKQQLQEMESRFNQMLMAANRGGQQPAQQQGPSPVEQRVAEVAQAMQAELSAFQNHDARKGAYDLSRYHQLKNQHDQLNARIGAAQQLQEMGITPQMLQQMRQPQNVNVEARVAMQTRFQQVAAQFPWIEGGADDPQFKRAAAVGRYRESLIAMGRPDNVQTDIEAALHVQNTMGIRPAAGVPRANPAPYTNPLGGDRGGGGARQEVKLPSAALRGVSKQEMEYIQKALFSEE